MTTTTKTKRGRFTPWCWEAERDEYNDESRRGWHLSKRTLRDMTYEYAPEKQYRYAIDYRMEHDEARGHKPFVSPIPKDVKPPIP